MHRTKLKKAHLICIPLLAVFAIQATDLNRWVYLYFQLAPNCPVLGVAAANRSHCNASNAPVSCEQDLKTSDNQPAEQRPTPFTPEDCPTCHMFAAARQIIDLQPDVQIHRDPGECLQRSANLGLPWFDSTQPHRARAPPII